MNLIPSEENKHFVEYGHEHFLTAAREFARDVLLDSGIFNGYIFNKVNLLGFHVTLFPATLLGLIETRNTTELGKEHYTISRSSKQSTLVATEVLIVQNHFSAAIANFPATIENRSCSCSYLELLPQTYWLSSP